MRPTKVVGAALLVLSGAIFVYYTLWTIITPFLESDNPIQRLFPPREYAIILPVFAGVTLMGLVAMLYGYLMIKESFRKRDKAKQK
ncbi:unnamed protein product [Vitrella brassicaformis CCMP3155]|uniref:Dolichol phosphate-mannose biosynthesis regulatory protein n=1 Tax=Vitrella brassicaformis (strain CCMP3155) TaxID=1169540 RepID=A0A0G4FPQ4_VITBC|nr:unnamed protein product [Vitrella brassicaformis CCMP3155]|eukprot:CEM16437.1 unnamed protein product [Vitrella brassicaformis CCMP3155]